MIETPRFDSLMFKLFRHRERSLNCNGHIYFFTTQSLREMCEKAGFEHKQCNYVGRSLSLERVAWNIGVMSKSEAMQAALRKLSAGLKLDTLQVRLNMHDMQRIIVRKPHGPLSPDR